MRVPIRKGGEYSDLRPDPQITQAKFVELSERLEKLKEVIRPKQASDVKKYAADGDFSENAAYQIAKGKLRRTNQELKELEDLLGRAEIIKIKNNNMIAVGHRVTLQAGDKTINYQILGSVETDPSKGIISHQSPLGEALLDKKLGEIVKIPNNAEGVEYKIMKIE